MYICIPNSLGHVFSAASRKSEEKKLFLRWHKTSFFIDKIPFTLHPWIGLIDNKTNAKQKQRCPSVSIQKRALKVVLLLPEWKKR